MNRYWKIVLLLALPLALYLGIRERNSWRPVTIVAPDVTGQGSPGHNRNSKWFILQFSPDGRYLGISKAELFPDTEGDIQFYDFQTRRLSKRTSLATNSFCFLDNQRFIGHRAVSDRQELVVCSVPEGRQLARYPYEMNVIGAKPDGTVLLQTFGENHALWSWNATSHAAPVKILSLQIDQKQRIPDRAMQVCYSWLLADRQTFLLGRGIVNRGSRKVWSERPRGRDCSLSLQFWDSQKKKPSLPVVLQNKWINAVASNAQGVCAICNSPVNSSITLFDYHTGQITNTFPAPPFEQMALSPDASLLAGVLPDDKLISLWDTKTGQLLRPLRGQEGNIVSLTFSPDGRTLASATRTGYVQLWRIK